MERNDFQTAVSRAEAKHGAEWHLMSQVAPADAIYTELRELDRKIVLQNHHPLPSADDAESAASLARP